MNKIISNILILFFCSLLVSAQNADTIKTDIFSSGNGKSSPLKKRNYILKSLLGETLHGKTSSDTLLIRGGFFFIGTSQIKSISKESVSSQDSQLKLDIRGELENNSILINCSVFPGILNTQIQVENKNPQGRFEILSRKKYALIDSTANSYIISQQQTAAGIYVYRFFLLKGNGEKIYSNELEIKVDKSADSFTLTQNFPNPFNSSTKIGFSLPGKMFAKITVFNLLGEKIKILAEDYFEEGFYEIQFDAHNLPSGLYFYSLEANSTTSTDTYRLIKRMIYLK